MTARLLRPKQRHLRIFEDSVLRHLHREQFIPADPSQVWDFFATPRNLDELTPAHLKFRIVSQTPGAMHPGQIIKYRISVLPGLWMRWVTEIRDVQPGVLFVDEQRSGPYKFWRHEHTFTPERGGVRMTDHITYDVGWGPFGWLVEKLWVQHQLKRIFDYRFVRVQALFGSGAVGSK